jgi:LysM repeat protein
MIIFKLIPFIALAFDLVSKVNAQTCSQSYTVVSGDTCSAIATKFGVTAAAIITANPAINSGCTNLQIGQILCIPGGSCSQSYTVVSGDTCSAIATKFGVTVSAIISANPAINSGCTNLQIGQVLCIPSASTSDNDSRLIAYLGNWQNCPSDAQVAKYTHIMVAFAVTYTYNSLKNICDQSCTIGAPVAVCNNIPNNDLVAKWRAAGKKVILSFGGAGMGGSWPGDVNNCWDFCFGKEDWVITQLTNIVKNQNFDGVDLDYEYFYSTEQQKNFISSVTTGLRAALPIGSIVTHAPMDSDLVAGKGYYEVLRSVSSSLSFLMPQYYNGITRPVLDGIAGQGPGRTSALSHYTNLVNNMFNGDPTRVLFGFCISDCSGTNSNANAQQAVKIMNDLKSFYPCNGGAFFWVAEHDSSASWSTPVSQVIQPSAGCSNLSKPASKPVLKPVPVTKPVPVSAPKPGPVKPTKPSPIKPAPKPSRPIPRPSKPVPRPSKPAPKPVKPTPKPVKKPSRRPSVKPSKTPTMSPTAMPTHSPIARQCLGTFCGIVEENIDYPGNDMLIFSPSDLQGCCDECGKVEGCVAYSWSSDRFCRLKGSKSPPVESPGTYSALLSSCTVIETGVDYPGNDIGHLFNNNFKTVEDCCFTCRLVSGCKYFSYSRDTQECWLKTSDANKGPNDIMISGSVIL